jgi:hypothetical protein
LVLDDLCWQFANWELSDLKFINLSHQMPFGSYDGFFLAFLADRGDGVSPQPSPPQGPFGALIISGLAF